MFFSGWLPNFATWDSGSKLTAIAGASDEIPDAFISEPMWSSMAALLVLMAAASSQVSEEAKW